VATVRRAMSGQNRKAPTEQVCAEKDYTNVIIAGLSRNDVCELGERVERETGPSDLCSRKVTSRRSSSSFTAARTEAQCLVHQERQELGRSLRGSVIDLLERGSPSEASSRDVSVRTPL
jgi:hypothetical protein